MKIAYRLFLFLLISAFLFGCSEKKVGIEGKLLDGRGQPLSGVTVIFKQVQATKGYEQFETKTLANGVFRIDGVMAASEYIITPVSDKWKTKVTTNITTLTEGQTMVLSNPIVIRFNALKDGTVIDTKTGLQWLISGVADLNSSNVLSSVKNMKDGGFTDWRLPTKDELTQLQGAPTAPVTQPETGLSQKTCCVWVAEPNSENVEWKFYVDDGNDVWASSKVAPDDRIVAVRTYVPGAAAPASPAPTTPATPAPAPSATSAAPPSSTPADIATPAAPSARRAAEKKPAAEPAAKLITKKDIPAVVLPAPAPAPKPVIEKQDIPAVKSDDGVLRASRKTCLANKGQPVKPRATAAPSVAAPSDEDAPAKQAPSAKSRTTVAPEVAASPAKQAPSTKVRTTSQRDRSGNSVTIQFAMSKSVISPEELAKLKAFYAKIKGKQGRIVIEGNSDSDGDAADNFRISGERALSAKAMLNKLDLNKTFDMKIAGLSDIRPIADSSTEAGRILNRRADITFIPESPDAASSPSIQVPAKSRATEAPEVAAPAKQLPSERVTTTPAVVKSEEGALRASRKACIAKKAQSGK
jgi:outer membrane protein OmpA-like peptidoglycan-associated protein